MEMYGMIGNCGAPVLHAFAVQVCASRVDAGEKLISGIARSQTTGFLATLKHARLLTHADTRSKIHYFHLFPPACEPESDFRRLQGSCFVESRLAFRLHSPKSQRCAGYLRSLSFTSSAHAIGLHQTILHVFQAVFQMFFWRRSTTIGISGSCLSDVFVS